MEDIGMRDDRVTALRVLILRGILRGMGVSTENSEERAIWGERVERAPWLW
jgi:hypothetical protein